MVACALVASFAGASTALAGPPAGYDLVWHDEFDGNEMDTSKWRHRLLGPRRAGENVEEAVGVDNGLLTITTWTQQGPHPAHYTGMISTRDTFRQAYGYFEASIDFNGASGMWSAFWLTSADIHDTSQIPELAGVELDVVEHRVTDGSANDISGIASLNTHWGGYQEHHQTRGFNTGDLGLGDGFHTYAIEWTPDGYRFFIDDVQVWDGADTPVSQIPQYMLLSSEVGEGWSGPIPDGGYGTFDDSNVTMHVDYVRVYSMGAIPEPASASLLALSSFLLLRRRNR